MHACTRSAKQKYGSIYIYFLMKTFLKTGVYIYIYIYMYVYVNQGSLRSCVTVFSRREEGLFVRPKYRCKLKCCHLFICVLSLTSCLEKPSTQHLMFL